MSATDAMTDLRMARDRIAEAIALEQAHPYGGSLTKRSQLNRAARHVDDALEWLSKATS